MLEWDNHAALETDGGTVTVNYDGSTNDPNGAIIMAMAPDSATTTICRVEDDGNATIKLPTDMSAGEAAIMVYHSTQGYLTGPDGLPIFLIPSVVREERWLLSNHKELKCLKKK